MSKVRFYERISKYLSTTKHFAFLKTTYKPSNKTKNTASDVRSQIPKMGFRSVIYNTKGTFLRQVLKISQ